MRIDTDYASIWVEEAADLFIQENKYGDEWQLWLSRGDGVPQLIDQGTLEHCRQSLHEIGAALHERDNIKEEILREIMDWMRSKERER